MINVKNAPFQFDEKVKTQISGKKKENSFYDYHFQTTIVLEIIVKVDK